MRYAAEAVILAAVAGLGVAIYAKRRKASSDTTEATQNENPTNGTSSPTAEGSPAPVAREMNGTRIDPNAIQNTINLAELRRRAAEESARVAREARDRAAAEGQAADMERLNRALEAARAEAAEYARQADRAREAAAAAERAAREETARRTEQALRLAPRKAELERTIPELEERIRNEERLFGIAAQQRRALVSNTPNYREILGYIIDDTAITQPYSRTKRIVDADSEEGRYINSVRTGNVTVQQGNTTITRSGRDLYADVLLVGPGDRLAATRIESMTATMRGCHERRTAMLAQVGQLREELAGINRQLVGTGNGVVQNGSNARGTAKAVEGGKSGGSLLILPILGGG